MRHAALLAIVCLPQADDDIIRNMYDTMCSQLYYLDLPSRFDGEDNSLNGSIRTSGAPATASESASQVRWQMTQHETAIGLMLALQR